MSCDVVCLRPEADFLRIGVTPPRDLAIAYCTPDDAALPALLREAHALVIPAVGPKLAPALFEGTKLALVQVTGAGLDRLDQPALTRLGIPVANVPGGSNSAVAEYAVSAASTLLRCFAWASAEVAAGRYKEFRARMVADNLAGLHGMAVGLVGVGTIGLAVAKLFAAYECKLAWFDPAPRQRAELDRLGARECALDELLATSDVVTLHVPLLPATRGMIGARELERMKRGAILINAARGGIVDEAALAEALRAGHLGGAAVDVYSTEPPERANPLLGLTGEAASRILLTPHIGGVTLQASRVLFEAAWDNVLRVLRRGEVSINRAY